jgi:excisionase family DNA binding protein
MSVFRAWRFFFCRPRQKGLAVADILERDRLLKPADAAEYLGLTLATIYTKASRRQLPTVKVGRSLRFRRADLEKIVQAGLRPALRPLHEAESEEGGQR